MTTKEIIETLQIAKAEVEWEYPMNYAVAFEEAIEILEKQIPYNPIMWRESYGVGELFIDQWKCKCGAIYEIYTEHYNYCPNCGQKIDWSDDNE